MKAAEYQRLRELIGTQSQLAKLLGVNQKTISNRENGKTRISKEAEIAIKEVTKHVKRVD